MPRKSALPFLALLSLTLLLVIAACTGGGDTPTATPTTPANGQTPEPTAEGEPHPIVTLDVQQNQSFMGEITEAARRILDEHHPWLRISARDQTQDDEFVEYTDGPAEKRNLMLLWSMSNNYDAYHAGLYPSVPNLDPFPMNVMAVGPYGCSGFGTWDENLVRLDQAAGKSINYTTEVSAQVGAQAYVVRALGLDDTEPLYLGANRQVQVIADRQADIIADLHMTGFTRPVPQVLQAMTEQRLYVVNATKEGIDAARAASDNVFRSMWPQPMYRGDLPEALGLNYDPIREEIAYCIGGQNPHWTISPDASEEVVYEFVKTIFTNIDDFDKYVTGDVATLKRSLSATLRNQSEFHPGARRAYEELGINYGLPYAMDLEQERAAAHGQELYVPPYIQEALND